MRMAMSVQFSAPRSLFEQKKGKRMAVGYLKHNPKAALASIFKQIFPGATLKAKVTRRLRGA